MKSTSHAHIKTNILKNTKNKYFCKGQQRTTCSDLIKTKEKDKWIDSGRFSLYDDTTAAVFTVTIQKPDENRILGRTGV